MRAPKPNLPLLRKVIEWAEVEALKDPVDSEWLQDAWSTSPEEFERDFGQPRCGTAYCIAGYTCQISGLAWTHGDEVMFEGVARDPGRVGRMLLGLKPEESATLFAGDNGIEDIRDIAEGIAARAGERL